MKIRNYGVLENGSISYIAYSLRGAKYFATTNGFDTIYKLVNNKGEIVSNKVDGIWKNVIKPIMITIEKFKKIETQVERSHSVSVTLKITTNIKTERLYYFVEGRKINKEIYYELCAIAKMTSSFSTESNDKFIYQYKTIKCNEISLYNILK